MQRFDNSEPFSPSLPFCRTNNILLSGRTFPWPLFFQARQLKISKKSPGDHRRFRESRFFNGDEAMVLRLSHARELFFLAISRVFRAACSRIRVHENTWRVVSANLWSLPGAPDSLTHSIRSVPQFRGLFCCFDELHIAVRKISANLFLAHCPHIDHFRPRNHAKLEV